MDRRQLWARLATVSLLNLAAMSVGALKDVAVAGRFGISDALDSFLVAALLVTFVSSTVAASFGQAFMPHYVAALEQEGEAAAQRIFDNAMVAGTLLLAVLAGAVAVAAGWMLPVIASAFDAAKLAQTRSLLWMMLVVLVLGGWTACWVPILNARGRFPAAAVAPGITPAVTLAMLFVFGPRLGVAALAFGVVAGALVETAWLAMWLVREGVSISPHWHGLDDQVRRLAGQCAPLVAASFLGTANSAVDQSMAAMLGPGSVGSLSYGGKVVGAAMAMASAALGSVVYPRFARLVAQREWRSLRASLREYLATSFALSLLSAAALIALSTPLIRTLFQRGAFSPADTAMVSRVQTLYLLQLPCHVAGLVAVRLLSAMNKNQIVALLGLFALLLNVAGNFFFSRWLGVAGIALSTSCVFAVLFGLLLSATSRAVRDFERAGTGPPLKVR
jgi:putative peptidoglycan lipid II flippase